jgi:hypothetical protein
VFLDSFSFGHFKNIFRRQKKPAVPVSFAFEKNRIAFSRGGQLSAPAKGFIKITSCVENTR